MLKVFALIVLGTFLQSQIAFAVDRLNVTVFYESLCPDSKKFIIEQLHPVYFLLGSSYLNLDLVPYGFANTSVVDSKVSFTCQHGPRECYANLIEACAINATTQDVGLHFVNCAFASSDAANETNLRQCATANNITWSAIDDCFKSDRANNLLIANGQRTHGFKPPITWIPTVAFNGVSNSTLLDDGLNHLFSTACILLGRVPPACKRFA